MNDAPPLSGGASDPHDPEKAIRVQRLEDTCQRIEALLTRIDDRLRKVEIDVAEMKGRIAQLPSTCAMTTMLGGQVAFAAAILAILKIAGAH